MLRHRCDYEDAEFNVSERATRNEWRAVQDFARPFASTGLFTSFSDQETRPREDAGEITDSWR